MLSEKEIELWYLGFPFGKNSDNGNGKKSAELVVFPAIVNDEMAERLYLGLPFKAA